MIIELHAIQSFTAANLNRDDTGLPKEVTFGGVRRARVSSQSWKRAMREQFRVDLGDLKLATRTKRAHEEIVKRLLAAEPSLEEGLAEHRAAVVLEAEPLKLKLVVKENVSTKTGQLLFFRAADLDALAMVASAHAAEIDAEVSSVGNPLLDGKTGKGKLSKEAARQVKEAMTAPSDAVDVALFGRMVAELPEGNVDASCQVAHAIGTHALSGEDDFYTAVDDLRPEETEGADMMGTISYNASCFYRYAAVDIRQLAENLGVGGGDEAVRTAVGAFTRAFVKSIPTGKQNTFAAHNPPTAVLAITRAAGQWNLANAFLRPLEFAGDALDAEATHAMLAQFGSLNEMYGEPRDEIAGALLASSALDADLPAGVVRVEGLASIVDHVGGGA
ncbi:MAG: type I-E CRISPR-associated protein Cas7/Cse4/CasC [Patulibacter sp.]